MVKMVRVATLFFLITLSTSCAKKTLVVLVPDPDGNTGSIVVRNKAGSVAISAPYQGTTIGDAREQPAAPVIMGTKDLDNIFSEALSIQPKRPLHFHLFCKRGVAITSDSEKVLPKIIAAVRERKSMYIYVIGHADTMGTKEWNMDLSRRRAIAVKDLLVRGGVAANTIWIKYHGEENPLFPTADGVWELKNRRIEVVVR